MLSFGDDTLFAHTNIEKNCEVLREQDGKKVSREENNGDVGEYSEENLPVSRLADKDTSKLSHPTKAIIKQSESFVKYFEESIIFSKINGRNTSSTSKGDKILSSWQNRSPREKCENKGSINMTNSREKHPADLLIIPINKSGKKGDISSIKNLCKNKSHNVCNNAISGSSVEMSASIDTTCDREISNIILSRALCTQERCKLESWGLPSNILQVLYYTVILCVCNKIIYRKYIRGCVNFQYNFIS